MAHSSCFSSLLWTLWLCPSSSLDPPFDRPDYTFCLAISQSAFIIHGTYQSLIKEMNRRPPYRQCDGDNPAVKVFSSQMTLLHVKLTQHRPAQELDSSGIFPNSDSGLPASLSGLSSNVGCHFYRVLNRHRILSNFHIVSWAIFLMWLSCLFRLSYVLRSDKTNC